MAGAPIFNSPDYLKNIADGTGLNPLLQNYWMVIHPPTLFLGFALTIVPFAFAVTALFRKEHRAWIRPALPWTLVAGMILGAGIIMGGFWAYESLSFGGYWAWDPVENASLVPWLLLIAGIHLMLIKKVTNTSTIASYILIIASFIFVLYATFLTRSGVLGETSVHSFTDLGLAGQLMQLVVVFVWLPIIAVSRNNRLRVILAVFIGLVVLLLPFYTRFTFYPLLAFSVLGLGWFALSLNKELDPNTQQDNVWSREFWMFIGALILVLSSLQVTITTSIPVFNEIFGSSKAPPADAIAHFNKWQLPFAVVIGMLTAIGQYFQYRDTKDRKRFNRELLILLGVSVLISIGELFLFELRNPLLIFFLLTSTYALVANLWYLIAHAKKLKLSGASITHIGFAMMLIGVLVSSAKKRIITADFTGSLVNYRADDRAENMMLKLGQTERLDDYLVTYLGDSSNGKDLYFKIHYESLDGKEEFDLYPNSQLSGDEGLMSNPDTRHYLTHDIYTHITALPSAPDSLQYGEEVEYLVSPGDSIALANGTIHFKGVDVTDDIEDLKIKGVTISRADLDIDLGHSVVKAFPKFFIIPEMGMVDEGDESKEAGMYIRFYAKAVGDGYKTALAVRQAPVPEKYVVMKAIYFPYINLLWLGTILMVLGFGVAAYNRLELKRGT
jgi:cytochrome c-type biogenesis protein CcmF